MLKGWAVVCGLWLWGATSALAQERDDEDTPDDLEWGEYTDDGEPIEDAPPLEVCNRQPSVDITLEWNLGSDAEFTLPPAGDGSTWPAFDTVRGAPRVSPGVLRSLIEIQGSSPT